MNAYQHLHSIYDAFMQDAPYDDWLAWLSNHLELSQMHVADVGCGTGRLTRELASRCRSITGVDLAEEMLAEAAAQANGIGLRVDWLCQDMRQLRLPSKVDLIVSSCDCMNYLLTAADVQTAFAAVAGNLVAGGWFCFDVLGPQRIRTLTDGFWYDLHEEAAVLFETAVDPETLRIQYDVHAFVQTSSGLYRRMAEQHEQQFHGMTTLNQMLRASGFEVCELLGDFGVNDPDESDRCAWVCRLIGQA